MTSGRRLFEREVEVRLLHGLVDRAAAGTGGIVLIEAAPGLGKSSLLADVVEYATEAGLGVLRAAGHELEGDYGWGVVRALFDPTLRRMPAEARSEVLDGPARAAATALSVGPEDPRAAQDPSAIVPALYWLTVNLTESRGHLMVVDDAHWADEPSLRLLVYLAARVESLPLAMVVATRPGEGPALLLDHLARRVPEVVTLAPLSAAASVRLVEDELANLQPALRDRCVELGAGVPLYLVEIVRALADGTEWTEGTIGRGLAAARRSLSHLLRPRLAALSPSGRAVADAIAVLESEVTVPVVAGVAGVDVAAVLDALDELDRAELVSSASLTFKHPLLRDVVYGLFGTQRRADAHRRCAQLLAAGRAPVERVCGHLLLVVPGTDAEVRRLLTSGAESAMSKGAPRSAISYLQRALLEDCDPHTRGTLLGRLGAAEAAAGEPRGAIDRCTAALALVDDPEERARLQLQLGRAWHDRGELQTAAEVLDGALTELRRRSSELRAASDLVGELEAAYLTSAAQVIGLDRLVQRVAGHLVLRPAEASVVQLGLISKALLIHTWAAQPVGSWRQLAADLIDDVRLVEDPRADPQSLWHLTGVAIAGDSYEFADQAVHRIAAPARLTGSVSDRAAPWLLNGRLRLITGPVDDVVEDARAGVDAMRDGGFTYLSGFAQVLVQALIERDQLPEARAVLAELDTATPQAGYLGLWRDVAAAALAEATGDDAEARDRNLAVGRLCARLGVVNPSVQAWRTGAARACIRLGRTAEADELLDEDRRLAEGFGAPRAKALNLWTTALAAEPDQSVPMLRRAADLLGGCGAVVDQSRVLTDLGAAIRRAGRPADARPVLREALGLASGAGALAIARQARENLHLAGGRVSAAASAADPLTPGERRVVDLARAGRTNRQIANTLYITVKAVEWHLGNAYRKLGIRSRAELTEPG